MFCECGHTLRTTTEQNDAQCVRCSRKATLGTLGIDWHNMGKLAYQNGAGRAPVMDNKVLGAIRNNGDVSAICKMWLDGWDAANLLD